MTTQFVDAEMFQGAGKKQFDLPFIIMEHVRYLARLCCVELTGGYYNESYTGNGVVVKSYVPASHEAFSNGVESLASLCAGFYDDDMLSKENGFLDELKSVRERLVDEAGSDVVLKSSFYSERVKIMKQYFRELCLFIKRTDFTKGNNNSLEDDAV